MADQFFRSGVAGTNAVIYDAGLRAHMQRVFNYMLGGLGLTGVIAFLVANTPLADFVLGTSFRWVAAFAPFVFLIFMQVKFNTYSAAKLQAMFWVFCGLMGLSMATLFFIFTQASIARAFFITAATFGTMSLWGYTTKRDLTGMGAFMMMGIVGLMIAGVVNLFLQSSQLQWMISIAVVLTFTGLTAYQVQGIKQSYSAGWGDEANGKLAISGALALYLSFINLFQAILSLTGGRRN